VKVLVATVMTVAMMFVIATSCSINHRSDQFSCSKPSDCSDGRECINGSCVVPGGDIDAAPGDGKPPPPDGRTCPDGCTSCDFNTMKCTIDCAGGADCTRELACPAGGWNCIFLCTVNDACSNGIDCSQAKSCSLTCSGARSCDNVNCGTGKCTASCTGTNACRGVDCSQSCACDVTCNGNVGACFDPGVFCPLSSVVGTCDTGLGCTSQPTGCHHCI
jgi:hypothetical protein